jgi:hypothetical protein
MYCTRKTIVYFAKIRSITCYYVFVGVVWSEPVSTSDDDTCGAGGGCGDGGEAFEVVVVVVSPQNDADSWKGDASIGGFSFDSSSFN